MASGEAHTNVRLNLKIVKSFFYTLKILLILIGF